MMLWVDVETTGLNPITDQLLEVGLTVTTDKLVATHSTSVIVQPLSFFWRENLDKFITNMHTKNGLLDEVQEKGVKAGDAELLLCHWIEEHGVEQLPMAGSNVAFDRSFLKHHMPRLEGKFHYRNIDVSTVKELCRRWDGVMPTAEKSGKHRALDDIAASIAELAHYRNTGFVGAA